MGDAGCYSETDAKKTFKTGKLRRMEAKQESPLKWNKSMYCTSEKKKIERSSYLAVSTN